MKTPHQKESDLQKEWIDEQLHSREVSFCKSNRSQLVSFRQLCSKWPWAKRSDVYTHTLHSYPAKLLPYIPIAFLSSSYVNESDKLLDCFAGTGTVLLESMVHEYSARTCWGIEINPLARLIAKVKTTPLDLDTLREKSVELYNLIQGRIEFNIPTFTNIDFWFRPSAIRDLAIIKAAIKKLNTTSDIKDFFWVCFSSIIRDMSRADPFIAPPVLYKPSKFKGKQLIEARKFYQQKLNSQAFVLFKRRVRNNIRKMESLVEKVSLDPLIRSEIIWDDARSMKRGSYLSRGRINKNKSKSLTGKIGFVITSPPYMAAQKYLRTTRLELMWLDLISEDQIHDLDKTSIGVERINGEEIKELIPTENPTADKLLTSVFRDKPLRAAIASRYFRDMRTVLNRIHRALRSGGICAMVVGNNTINKKRINNHHILSEMAHENNMFKTKVVLRDHIKSYGMITKRHDTAGIINDEYVIVLKKVGG